MKGGGVPRSESASRLSGSASKKQKAEPQRAEPQKAEPQEPQRAEPEKPALVRQSTFIKEAPSPTLKRKLEESSSAGAESPSSPETPLPPAARRPDVNRSHSESPSRPQEVSSSRLSRTGTWKRENSGAAASGGAKHSSSLPRVGTWKRTGSSSSVLSASSESSEKGRGEDGAAGRSKGTWRKTKSGDASAAKAEDVWVRLEDCPVNNPRSPNAPPVIDSPAPSKIPSSSSSCSSNLNLRRSCESLDDPPPPDRQQPQQRGVPQRSGAVAARVSPFNYTPSPRKGGAEVSPAPTPPASSTSTTPARPSLIPTPVIKKREPKGGDGAGGGERGSYIVTSV